MSMKARLTYSDDAFATIETSATTQLANQAVIKGTKGTITVSDFGMKCEKFNNFIENLCS